MLVSVVLCTYTPEMHNHVREAAESVLGQTYEAIELIIVSDGSSIAADLARDDFGTDPRVCIVELTENRGLSAARNAGILEASGDVIAFIDDDAVAYRDWIETLVDVYKRRGVKAAGGRMVPRWVDRTPDFLPSEFYWLVGVTHDGYPTEECEVRNTFGSNISFQEEVFQRVGLFNTSLGRRGDANVQGEETELAIRMGQEFGEGVWYTPNALVEHKVFNYRTKPLWLLKRSFFQGYSKWIMSQRFPDDEIPVKGEREFLSMLIFSAFPTRARKLITSPSKMRFMQLIALAILTIVVGIGFLFGAVKDKVK